MDHIFKIIIKDIADKLASKSLTLAVAESCTGGLICNEITNIPGASAFFTLGAVCYSAESKIKVLGISAALLQTYGTVSKETAVAMAQGIRKISGADLSISTTGIAGPDTVEGRKKGLVFVAVARKGAMESKMLKLIGSREEIKRAASLEALNLLSRMLDKWT
jgi:nicotinamide-nucleotide amidase